MTTTPAITTPAMIISKPLPNPHAEGPAEVAPREHKPKTVASVTKTVMRNLDGLHVEEQRRVLAAVGMILGTSA